MWCVTKRLRITFKILFSHLQAFGGIVDKPGTNTGPNTDAGADGRKEDNCPVGDEDHKDEEQHKEEDQGQEEPPVSYHCDTVCRSL